MLPFLAAAIDGPIAAPLDARTIYLRARAAVNARPLPPYVVFTFENASGPVGRDVPLRERLRIAVRTADGHAFVRTVRTETGYQGRLPPVVVGENAIFPNTPIFRLGDFPTASFGLRDHESRPGFFDPASETASRATALRTIGRVTAVAVPYDVRRLPDGAIFGEPMYRLALRPLRDPRHNVLREMWVDETTFEPRRYVAERFVGDPPLFSYDVTIDDEPIAGHLINDAMHGLVGVPDTLDASPILAKGFVFANERIGAVRISVSDVSYPQTLPPWLFDPQTYRFHRADPLPPALDAVGIPPTLPAIRRLVYDVDAVRAGGLSAADVCSSSADAGAAPSPAPDARSEPTGDGPITLTVVAATDDGSVVVDAGDGAAQPARVVVAPDGSLGFDDRIALTLDETLLLQLLGRDVGSLARRPSGAGWKAADDRRRHASLTSFRPLGELSATTDRLCLTTSATHDGARSAAALVTYAPDLEAPLAVLLAAPADPAAALPDLRRLTLHDDSFAAGAASRAAAASTAPSPRASIGP